MIMNKNQDMTKFQSLFVSLQDSEMEDGESDDHDDNYSSGEGDDTACN
jgi:hypothetical protein